MLDMITNTHITSELGERLRAKRLELGWTQERLGAESGTTQAVIQKIENGKSLRPRKLDEIASALGVDPAWLMFGRQSPAGLDEEAMEVVAAWSKLHEPYRSNLKNAILRGAAGAESG